MKTNKNLNIFFGSVAWSWFAFGILSVVFEFFRPGYVDYLVPVWVFFFVAACSSALSNIFKSKI